MKRIFLILCLSFMVVGIPGGHPGHAQETVQENLGLAFFEAVQTRARSALDHPATPEKNLARIRKSLEALEVEARKLLVPLNDEKSGIESRLQALGPAPDKDGSDEAPEIASNRQALEDQLSKVDARLKAIELKRLEALSLIDEISKYRHARFVDKLLYKGPAPSSPKVWQQAWYQSSAIFSKVRAAIETEIHKAEPGGPMRVFSGLAGAVVLAYFLGFPIRRFLIRKFSYGDTVEVPTYSQQVREAICVGLARLVPVLLAILILAISLKFLFPFTDDGGDILAAAVLGGSFFTITRAFTRTVLAPRRPKWRIPTMSDLAALSAFRKVQWLALIPAIDLPVLAVFEKFEASRAVLSVHDFLITFLAAIPIVGLTRKWVWHSQAPVATGTEAGLALTQTQEERGSYSLIRFLVALTAVSAPVIAFLGYSELGFYLTTRLVQSAALIGLLVLAFLISRDITLRGLTRSQPMTAQSLSSDPSEQTPVLHFWWSLGLGLVFLLLGLAGIALLWGVAQDDLTSWAGKLITGYEVGGMNISLVGIGVAIAAFVVIFMLTRFIQRMLGNNILPMTRLDQGAQDSLRTMVGYVGFVMAALAAIYTAGFDLTNLAIVAGALSLGIGFGLQNVVNNFVSGLILLVERPIKVGDWVITASAQGYVKRIKVRATEVETFDKATVIIPNSELISAPVTNWFFKDRGGRVVIPIGVAYDSDADQVREILLACARDNPRVLRYPAPTVYFTNFGNSSLDFSLRFHLGDIDWMMAAGSEVRFEILKRFREENIEIPYPQQDIHLRNIDQLNASLKTA